MLSWILQISIISIIFIFLVHHLLCFFKTTLTVPKMKDLVNSPLKKYQDIFDTISNSNINSNTNLNSNTNFNQYLPTDGDYTDINLLPTENATGTDMKDELKSFLKKQLNNSDTNELEGANSSSNFGSIF